MNFRRYVHIFTWILVLFLAANFVVWHFWTEQILSSRHGDGGDLARLGYLPQFRLPRHNHDDLPRRHLSLPEYRGQKLDLVTIGDSFSNGGGSGRNRYYQDYLASRNNITIMNVGLYRTPSSGNPFHDPLETLLLLLNSGELERFAPRMVLVGVSEKQALTLLAHPLDLALREPVQKVRDYHNYEWYGAFDKSPQGPENFVTNGNTKFLYWNLVRLFTGKTNSQVALAPLKKQLFSVQGDTLLYLRADVQRISQATDARLALMNDNLNRVADLLARRGIKLYFMLCVDKYNLYRPYFADDGAPKSELFERFRKLPKRYDFIDTKAILAPLLERGELDVFYPDDTHWSWKASQGIAEKVPLQ